MSAVIENPIINSPYAEPRRHWQFDEQGLITDELAAVRRPSESWIPVPTPRKGRGKAVQTELDILDVAERRRRNEQVDQIRDRVAIWRQRRYPNVTPTTRRLLEYWSDEERENRVLFCQREAAETAVFIAEAAPKQGDEWVRNALAEQNLDHNDGLPRVAFKMATGAGKTVVMAMLIAWQTLNKVASPNDARFTRRFLIVTPGVTIRDRLRVLLPADEENYYKQRDLVPADLWGPLRQAEIVVTNFHSFLPRATKEGRGISANTKLLLTAGGADDPFVETPDQMVNRVLREFSSSRSSEIIVLNDEAHHCYRGRAAAVGENATTEDDLAGEEKKEAHSRNAEAGVWFSGLRHIARKIGIKTVYDLSATPFFLKGSGYPEGYLFPWVVSDFSLMDAIEAGIVKIPRVPVDDDAIGDEVAYLHLWSKVGTELPKRLPKGTTLAGQGLPGALEGALRSLYGNYAKAFARWESSDAAARGETPPVFIVVCNNTTVSKLVYDFVSGFEQAMGRVSALVPGALPLFSNVGDGHWLARPRTILVDSIQLESGEGLKEDFKKIAAAEIEAFRAEHAARTGRPGEELDDATILREVMNTVGKAGRLGEGVRCVVSVSMLTEGWDANTVTHILGVRAFGSQLLCEQVVGRGLRRRSYTVNEDGMFEPEYAEVYGVPFSFIRVSPENADPRPRRPQTQVKAVEDRADARIVFPKLDGYRIEIPDGRLTADFGREHHFEVPFDIASWTEIRGVVGEQEVHDLSELAGKRPQEVAFRLAHTMLNRFFNDAGGQPRRWLFPDLVRIARQWLDECVTYAPGARVGHLTLAELREIAAEQIWHAITPESGPGEERVTPIFRRYDPWGSTDAVDFFTTKRTMRTDPRKCHVNHVVLDGFDGNTWEQIMAQTLESLPRVAAYVKNDHLEFDIPYVHGARTRRYLPDFLVRLVRRDGDVPRHLIVEVSGSFKTHNAAMRAMTSSKADTARNLWCAAVNNHGGYGRWGYIEITDPVTTREKLDEAIDLLHADAPITGLPT
ncbi:MULTISPECIES: BPTD_3080 family restriction endonuclease [Protofrankia]|uniref:BPTD_3080 family restriction endonuclease n=1 Tax=Protofrankia TaxID=2994361 RepID=UPI00069BDF41|nr:MULTISPECIES: DEAD/DEAH box helicase family protein [Protofrankia]ONH34889.1 restriction endonuclease [Protofrankia sp. BMG5.30]